MKEYESIEQGLKGSDGGMKMHDKIHRGEHASWLFSCPCSDGNFKSHLKNASKEDIELVLSVLSENKSKTKIKILTAELNRRNKQ